VRRLYPARGTRFVRRAALHRYFRASGYSAAWVRDMDGVCCPRTVRKYDARGGVHTSGLVAEVHLHAERTGAGLIAHEMFHATLAWGLRAKCDLARSADEEYLAQVQQHLVRLTTLALSDG
jgi:hypothetical protein